jgi:hypothetical protein
VLRRLADLRLAVRYTAGIYSAARRRGITFTEQLDHDLAWLEDRVRITRQLIELRRRRIGELTLELEERVRELQEELRT